MIMDIVKIYREVLEISILNKAYNVPYFDFLDFLWYNYAALRGTLIMKLNFTIIEDDKNLSVEDYINAISNNHAVAISMQKEIVPIIMNSKESYTLIEEERNTTIKEDSIIKEENNFFDDTVEFYMSILESISDENFLNGDIDYALPSKNDINFDNIISRICCEYLKQIKEIEELLFEEESALTAADLNDFKEEIKILNRKIEIIKEEQEEKNEDNIIKNNLIFVPTSSGNTKVIEDLSSVSEEYYDGFKGLFQSIIDGTFKNVKRFVNNDKYSGLCEVRDFKIRVLFSRIGKNDYAVISAFVKKTDVDKAYTTKVELSYKNFLNYKDYLTSQLNDPEFEDNNQKAHDELFNLLDTSNRNNKIKEKVDDTNGKIN